MNDTNRALNRFFIFIVGLLVLAAGAAALILGAVASVTKQWKTTAAQLQDRSQSWVSDPVIGTASLLVIGVIVVALILVVLLLIFIGKQGHGRTAAALRTGDAASSIRVDLAVPKALLEQHLKEHPDLAGLRISAYEVRGTPMLKIAATCRRGVSPADVADLIGRAVQDLERIIGTDVPAFVQLSGGFRAGRVATAQVA